MTSQKRRMASDGPPPFKRPRISDSTTSKQQKISKSRTVRSTRAKRSAGKLSKFTLLPLDAIFEIVSKLEPLDLLHLSHASKSFRALLNPNINHHLWAAARRNIPELPECPLDLNEAQYTSLVFDNRCQACNGICKFDSVEYAIRCRLCQPCHKELVRKGNVIIREVILLPLNQVEEVCALLPRSIQAFNGTITNESRSTASTYENKPWSDYLTTELQAVTKQYVKLRDKPDQLAAFVQERRDAARQMTETGIAIQEWASRYSLERKVDKLTQTRYRLEDITNKLVALGWEKDDFPDYFDNADLHSEWENHVAQPKSLTPRSWKILQPKLVVILERVKEIRRQRRIAQRKRCRFRELHSIWPQFAKRLEPTYQFTLPDAVLEQLPSIIQLVDEREAEIEITADRLSLDSDKILTEFKNRVEELRGEFVGKLGRMEGSSRSVAPIDRTTAVFVCTMCSNDQPLLSFENVLRHTHDNSIGWQVNHFRHSEGMRELVVNVLSVLELPLDSSWQAVQDLGYSLICNCGHPSISGKQLGFLDLVSHLYWENEWFETTSGKWSPSSKDEVLNDHDPSRFSSLIRRYNHSETSEDSSNQTKYLCRPCQVEASIRTRLNTENMAIYHLRAKHGLEFKNKNVLFDATYGTFLSAFLFGLGVMDDAFFDSDFMGSDSDDF